MYDVWTEILVMVSVVIFMAIFLYCIQLTNYLFYQAERVSQRLT